MSEAPVPRALADLASAHEDIRSRLYDWLEAVAAGEAHTARARFEDFDALLRSHAAMEEEHLIPLFAARGLERPGCTADILRSEHDKIRRLLDRARAQLAPPAEPIPPRLRVDLVLDSRNLRELLEHHDQRERTGFFTALDGALGAEERTALYEICERSHARAASRESKPPSSCNS